MNFWNNLIRVESKYKALNKFIMNDFKASNETMQRILTKYKLEFFLTRHNGGKGRSEPKNEFSLSSKDEGWY
jgi:hypothetical protein